MTGQSRIPDADIEKECGVIPLTFELSEISSTVKTVDVDGTEYRIGQVLTAAVDEDDIPTFAVIKNILMNNGQVFFIVYNLVVNHFVKHFNSCGTLNVQ